MFALINSPEKELFVTSEDDALVARNVAAKLQTIANGRRDARIDLGDKTDPVRLLAREIGLIDDLLLAIAGGKPISILPHDHELTPLQAADVLNVPLSRLTELLAKGEIPNYMVETQCRVLRDDVVAYKKKADARRRAVEEDARDVLFPNVHPFEMAAKLALP